MSKPYHPLLSSWSRGNNHLANISKKSIYSCNHTSCKKNRLIANFLVCTNTTQIFNLREYLSSSKTSQRFSVPQIHILCLLNFPLTWKVNSLPKNEPFYGTIFFNSQQIGVLFATLVGPAIRIDLCRVVLNFKLPYSYFFL